jgi:hypothetical protein
MINILNMRADRLFECQNRLYKFFITASLIPRHLIDLTFQRRTDDLERFFDHYLRASQPGRARIAGREPLTWVS